MKVQLIQYWNHLHESSFMNSVWASLGNQMKYFIFIKSKQEWKYSVIKTAKLLLVLSINIFFGIFGIGTSSKAFSLTYSYSLQLLDKTLTDGRAEP